MFLRVVGRGEIKHWAIFIMISKHKQFLRTHAVITRVTLSQITWHLPQDGAFWQFMFTLPYKELFLIFYLRSCHAKRWKLSVEIVWNLTWHGKCDGAILCVTCPQCGVSTSHGDPSFNLAVSNVSEQNGSVVHWQIDISVWHVTCVTSPPGHVLTSQ